MQEKRKRGRPPKSSTIESRIEDALRRKVNLKEEKRGPGRPKLDYMERPEHIRFVIDCAAMGYSPRRIVQLLKEKYGETDDRVIAERTVDSYRKKYFSEVERRERELRAELPILLPSHRVRVLQRIIDEALEGVPIVNKMGIPITDNQGNPVKRKDHSAAIQAIKEMNAMQKEIDAQKVVTAQEMDAQREVEEQKATIREHIEELATQNGKTALEILREMTETLAKEYPEAIEQLTSEFTM